jgi:diguanylate cyclase (GGDEF)-like protein
MRELPLRVAVGTLITILYATLAAWELWRVRRQVEVSIVPAVALLLMHGLFCASLVLLYRGQAIERIWSGQDDSFLTWRFLENFLFAIGLAFLTLAMVRERAELRYRAVANRDPLTGIGNRRAFMDGAQALLASCQRGGRPAALLLCDLDHFKRLNDSHGHAMGDAALVAFGRVLARSVRQHDVCGRIGGEEFACLLPDADAAKAAEVAERIRGHCSELVVESTLRVGVSVSIGVASVAGAGYDLAALLAQADEALYRAKAAGRNRVECSAGGMLSGAVAGDCS